MEHESLVGTLFAGRFRMQELLGRGGMGAVYRGQHVVMQRDFAIKVILRSLITDVDVAARFRREARLASRVVHPNLTSVFDFGQTEEGRPYLVMEYVQGETLFARMQREGAMPLQRALPVLQQIAAALCAAHASQVVHRDLKPQNVMLTASQGRRDFVKILDFGLAKVYGFDATSELSSEGETFGTPEYMSPEHCAGEELDHRADIYAFGVLAFALLTGKVPFGGKKVVAVMDDHLRRPPPVPSAMCPGQQLPPEVDRMILRCLAKHPADRQPDMNIVCRELQDLVEPEPGPEGAIAVTLPPGTVLAAAINRRRLATTMPPVAAADENTARLPTSVHAPADGWPPSPEQRRRAIEELACGLRDRGLGSGEMTLHFSQLLRAEDELAELMLKVADLRDQLNELEATTRQRESRLEQALAQVEHDRETLRAEQEAPDERDTLPWGSMAPLLAGQLLGRLDAEANQIGGRLRRIREEADSMSSRLRQELEPLQTRCAARHAEAIQCEQRLVDEIREACAGAARPLDAELQALLELVGRAG